jgi:hypothetical protein
MPLEQPDVTKIDFGPCTAEFGGTYLGRTKGETAFTYSIETYELVTEEDGKLDEIIINDPLIVTVPIIYTDVDTLVNVIPFASKDAETGKLLVGKSIGTRLAQYADSLVLTPISSNTNKLNVYKAYPKPGPLNFSYSRSGERIANIDFIAIRDETKDVGEDYFDIEPVTPQVETVVASPGSGDYDDPQDVELSTSTTGATIYYTVDGSTPTAASTEYTEAITVDSAQVIKAIAIKADWDDSEVASFYYVGALSL